MEIQKVCEQCGMPMPSRRKRFCSYTCRYPKRVKQPEEPKKETPAQTVSEILKIGRAHGIYSYGKIVQAMERGEIE